MAGAGPRLTESTESCVSPSCSAGTGAAAGPEPGGLGGLCASPCPQHSPSLPVSGWSDGSGCADGSQATCEYSPGSAGFSPLSALAPGPGAALGLFSLMSLFAGAGSLFHLTSLFAGAGPHGQLVCGAVPQVQVRVLKVLAG